VTGVLPPDLVQAGIATNPVYALDLAFFLPLCVLAGTGVIRRTGARIVAVTMLLWVPLMGAGVAGGFLLMALGGERVPLPVVAVIAVLSVASMALAARAVTRAPAARIDAPTMRGAALSA